MRVDDPAFAARINEVCDDLKLPAHGRQTALAKRMDLTPNAARKWLLGQGMPEMSTAVKLAQMANVSVLWLLQGVLPKRPGHVEIRGLVLMEALQDLPAEGRAEVLRYLRFKVLETFGSSPRAERYLRAIDSAGDLKVTTAPDDPFHGGGTRFGVPTATVTPQTKRRKTGT